ncbi:MAG: hypothetical protein WD294_13035 [Phycisphaeraceae bacterium]
MQETEEIARQEELKRQVRSVVDRRSGLDRRRRPRSESDTGLEHRRGPGRRRTDFTRTAEEGEMSQEQFLFVMAVDAFKRVNGKQFPTWTEVLEVIRKLGYRKTAASELNLPNMEDWHEPADAPAMPAPTEEEPAEF